MRTFKVTDIDRELCDGDRSRPGRGRLAIDVTATALNRGECRRAVGGGFPSDFVPGWDTADIINEIGPDTEAPPVGTRVIARALSGGAEHSALLWEGTALRPGPARLGVDTSRLNLFDKESGARLS